MSQSVTDSGRQATRRDSPLRIGRRITQRTAARVWGWASSSRRSHLPAKCCDAVPQAASLHYPRRGPGTGFPQQTSSEPPGESSVAVRTPWYHTRLASRGGYRSPPSRPPPPQSESHAQEGPQPARREAGSFGARERGASSGEEAVVYISPSHGPLSPFPAAGAARGSHQAATFQPAHAALAGRAPGAESRVSVHLRRFGRRTRPPDGRGSSVFA